MDGPVLGEKMEVGKDSVVQRPLPSTVCPSNEELCYNKALLTWLQQTYFSIVPCPGQMALIVVVA